MFSDRQTAIIAGVLWITATAAYSLGQVILSPVLTAPEYLISVSANETQVLIAMLLELTDAAAVAGIAVMLFPILKKHSETLALGYVGARILESVFVIVSVIFMLSLINVSQEFVSAGASDASYFQALGTLLLAARDWTNLIGINFVFGLGTLIIYYLLYQSKLVPRFISVWGLIGGTLLFAAGLLMMFGLITPVSVVDTVLSIPIAVQEMVLAVWLIVKGFDLSAINS
jgi:hypothetical protein